MSRRRRVLVGLLRNLLALPLFAACLLVGVNVFVNIWLPPLLNLQPERLRMHWGFAWTWNAHRVHVRGFEMVVQGPLDQWYLHVDHAALDVELRPLLEQRFQADHVVIQGAAFHYRGRVDAKVPDGVPPPTYDPARTATVPGLENPPKRDPDRLYGEPAAPWLIALDDVDATHIEDLWLGDVRFVGDLEASGDAILLPGRSVDLTGLRLLVNNGDVTVEQLPVLRDLYAEAEVTLEGFDPSQSVGVDVLRFVDANLHLVGHVYDLSSFTSIFGEGGEVGIAGGSGVLHLDLRVKDGEVLPPSHLRAQVQDVEAFVGTWKIVGDALLTARVQPALTRLRLVFGRYGVERGVDQRVVAQGEGFRFDGIADRVHLDRAPDHVSVLATLPPSEVPDLRPFDVFLPRDVGLDLRGGRAVVSGTAAVDDGDAVSGQLTVDVPQFQLAWQGRPIHGALMLVARVGEGSLTTGTYDVTGTTLRVERVGIGDTSKDWWARVKLGRSRVTTAEPNFLHANADFALLDTGPVFALATREHPVPDWVRSLLTFHDLHGEVQAELGGDSIRIPHFFVKSPKAEVRVWLAQKRQDLDALLYARLGPLGVATALHGNDFAVELTDARRWYNARLDERGVAADELVPDARGNVGDAPEDRRAGITSTLDRLQTALTKKPKRRPGGVAR